MGDLNVLVANKRQIFRIFILALLALWSLGHTLPDAVRFWHPLGTFGYRFNVVGEVISVQPGSAADMAGIKPGDKIDLPSVPPAYRSKVKYVVSPGTRIPLTLIHSGELRTLWLQAQPESLTMSQRLILAARLLASVVFTMIGGFLVLARPGIITWSFNLFCVGFNPGPFAVSMGLLPFPWVYVYYVIQDVLTVAGGLGALLFALQFPHPTVAGWRRRLVRLAPYLFVAVSALNVYADLASNYFGLHTRATAVIFSLVVFAALVVAVYTFYDTYRHTSGNDRQKIRWVILGFTVGLVGTTLSFTVPLNVATPEWLAPSLLLSIVCIPVTVGYAVIRHRVIDVRFVVSRAVVYAIMTTILVAFFAFIDWLLGKELAAGKLALASEVTLAIMAGLGLDRLHRVVDHSVTSVLFRDRRAAVDRLEHLARQLQDALSMSDVDELLVNEPRAAFRLSSSAIFRMDGEGTYTRRASRGWADSHAQVLRRDDQLVSNLESTRKALRIDTRSLDDANFPKGSAQPALALPITIGKRGVAIGLYGVHSGGEDLAPDEVRAIDRLEPSAAVAYGRLEVEAVQPQLEELDILRERVASLTHELDSLRADDQRMTHGSSPESSIKP